MPSIYERWINHSVYLGCTLYTRSGCNVVFCFYGFSQFYFYSKLAWHSVYEPQLLIEGIMSLFSGKHTHETYLRIPFVSDTYRTARVFHLEKIITKAASNE